MIFVDASALVAIIGEESEAQTLTLRLDQAESSYTSPLAVYEAVLGLARSTRLPLDKAVTAIDDFLRTANIAIIPITAAIGDLAIEAFARFGRGNHPARLNMGDCFAYACARSLGVPLLFKGGDFTKTDIATA